MNNLRAICRPYPVISSVTCGSRALLVKSAVRIPSTGGPRSATKTSPLSPSSDSSWTVEPWYGANRRQTRRSLATHSYDWNNSKSPYETLELERDADEEQIKVACRRLVKFYHPDVYDGTGALEEEETTETRFIKIQAAYELLLDEEKRREYDIENRVNPVKASRAWMEWLMNKRKAFDRRGDMAISAWGEQQHHNLNLKARRLARSKIDPEEERRILEKQKKASSENVNNTLRLHALVLRKRDIMRRKAEDEKKRIVTRQLTTEGLELEDDDDKKSL